MFHSFSSFLQTRQSARWLTLSAGFLSAGCATTTPGSAQPPRTNPRPAPRPVAATKIAPVALTGPLSTAKNTLRPAEEADPDARDIQLLPHPEPARTKGFQFKLPPDLVKIDWKRRNSIFFVGEPLRFQLDKPAATFEVRDYWGNLVDRGAANATTTLKAQPPGWYKLYLFGAKTTPEWGDVVGGTTFCVFRPDARIPTVPTTFLALKRVDPTIDFKWNGTSPALGKVPEHGFRVVWSGFIQPAFSETYDFMTGTDYGCRMWIGDQLLIDHSVPNRGKYIGTMALVAGRKYPVRMEYVENRVVGGEVHLLWHSKSQPSQPVPQSALFSLDNKGTQGDGLTAQYFDDTHYNSADGAQDVALASTVIVGPERFQAEAGDPAGSIVRLEHDIAVARELYLGRDLVRPRALLIAFPNGTDNLAGVRQIVEHFKGQVGYYEPRNEPNFNSSGTDFAVKQMKPFYDTVKAADPKAKVLGPGLVEIRPSMLGWDEDFFKAGGGNSIDGFSFHIYNGVNGDFNLARQSLDGLNALLKKYGQDKKELWQTEQGFFAAVYGSYQPRLQGHWTMTEMMAFEQYGIPKEHNHLWYDVSHGFWDVPAWWENEDGSLNPAAPLMRVWSEELFGTRYARAFNFGDPGNKMFIGSLFSGPGKTVAAFQSAGSPNGQVQLRVAGAGNLRLVSAFGVESTLPVVNGLATLRVPELPVYVELNRGQTVDVVPTNWGANLARTATVSSSVPVDPDPQKAKNNDIAKVNNGALENWYYLQQADSDPWNAVNPKFPATVDITLPSVQTVSHVVVYAAPPWQKQSTLTDYDLQYDDGGTWRTLDTVRQPTKTFGVFTPPVRTTVDSFFSDGWVFQHSFKPVRTSKIRLLVRGTTFGGGATKMVDQAGGQSWGDPVLMLREVEVYGR